MYSYLSLSSASDAASTRCKSSASLVVMAAAKSANLNGSDNSILAIYCCRCS